MTELTLVEYRSALHTNREERLFTVTERAMETRDGEPGSTLRTFDGYASLTETPYEMEDMFGAYTEVVRAGAFTRTLADNDDVRLLINHAGIPLARTKSGTLQLNEDEVGLHCLAQIDTRMSIVADLALAMDRQDLDQMSFMFQVTRQQWSPDYMQRDIQEVRLFDVSPVTFPAAPATSASLRNDPKIETPRGMPLALASSIAEATRLRASRPA